MKIQILTWNHKEIIFDGVTLDITKSGYIIIQNGIELYENETPCSKIEITYHENGNFDITIQEW